MTSLKHINNEIVSKLQGTVKVDLASLFFAIGPEEIDEVDKDNVERLVKIFELEGCNRLSPAHSIPGSISADVLQTALAHSSLTIENLRDVEPPTLYLPPGLQIECLQGKHRLAALRESKKLHPWWTVRLYVAKRLYKRDSLAGAIRLVLEMPGQRKHFKLGVWKRIITEGCDEEIVHYLRLIHDTFAFIMGSDTALRLVDEETVQSFELRAPGVSHQDDLYVSAAVSENAVLWYLEDESAREQVIRRLRNVHYLIPTIYSLQMDFYYLQQCTSVMRRLISGKDRLPVTVQSLAWSAFTLPHASVFSPESDFLGNLKLLYLYIMQTAVELSGENPLLEDNEEKPEPLQYDESAWVHLAMQAKGKGFDSDEISRLCSVDLERQVASNLLQAARPPSGFDWGKNFDKLVDMQVKILKEAQPIQNEPGSPELITDRHGEPIARRCGRQYSKAYAHDRHFYTVDLFTCMVQRGSDVTSLFVRRSVFHAFWGIHEIKNREGSGNEDDMPDAPEEAGVSGSDESLELCAPEADEDDEMRDAPAFSRHSERKQPRQTLRKRKAQRDRLRDGPVAKVQSKATAKGPRRATAAGRSSAVTTFIPQLELQAGPQDGQQATEPDHRLMTMIVRKDGNLEDARQCRRSSVIQAIDESRMLFLQAHRLIQNPRQQNVASYFNPRSDSEPTSANKKPKLLRPSHLIKRTIEAQEGNAVRMLAGSPRKQYNDRYQIKFGHMFGVVTARGSGQVRMIRTIKGPNADEHIYSSYDLQDNFLISEFMETSLRHLGRSPIYPNEEQLSSILHQVLSGVEFLLQNNLVHERLSPANILVNAAGEVKISDIDNCRRDGDGTKLLESFSGLMMKLMDKEKAGPTVTGLSHPDRWSDAAFDMFTLAVSKPGIKELMNHRFLLKRDQKELWWLVLMVLISAKHDRC
ncbi:hypothetical protein SODALDRAFT_337370 [Sodiomyces alkalinus F11]|uniref:Protein kinase domain-containing protein n=1 Tax=Sodiomyces alkalinus (strain CBS 110278 / VKM F-3762 / F11) TaxID=1314773 RepID=A0A3N2PLJ2_SODAK|nr:hypothetical protein SODALDRAFT_337370 [Sodiomyces alkalinus F11]ROT35349.1 hypothetical protein SODALDRAFT_337370 [Sodiomyces alkalinus F11]